MAAAAGDGMRRQGASSAEPGTGCRRDVRAAHCCRARCAYAGTLRSRSVLPCSLPRTRLHNWQHDGCSRRALLCAGVCRPVIAAGCQHLAPLALCAACNVQALEQSKAQVAKLQEQLDDATADLYLLRQDSARVHELQAELLQVRDSIWAVCACCTCEMHNFKSEASRCFACRYESRTLPQRWHSSSALHVHACLGLQFCTSMFARSQ